MSLKELTKDKHKEAETTNFMKAVFSQTLPEELWIDFTYQKTLLYNAIEGCAGASALIGDMPDIRRAHYLYRDYTNRTNGKVLNKYNDVSLQYYKYIMNLYPDKNRIMAHLYVWHMGDLFGGQMIKKLIPGPHESLDFKNSAELIQQFYSKIDDSMADEANVAFEWAIELLKYYDHDLEQNTTAI